MPVFTRHRVSPAPISCAFCVCISNGACSVGTAGNAGGAKSKAPPARKLPATHGCGARSDDADEQGPAELISEGLYSLCFFSSCVQFVSYHPFVRFIPSPLT